MRHVLVETATDAEVLPEMRVLDMRNEIFEVVGFRIPHNDNSTGRVIVRKPGSEQEREYYPSVFELAIREIKE